jgi:TolB-like protein/DNA-binding winged helix-turn-helix (wHTH) protein/tetratricopeptide (TPR) repeat protein
MQTPAPESRGPALGPLRFGAFEIEPRTGELRKNGFKVRLDGQPLLILTLLLERPGQLVTRDELKGRLWRGDTFVDFEHSINAAVKRLREALDDSAEAPRFVETLPRRGYRFICPVAPVDGEGQRASPAPSLRQRRRPLSALIALAVALVGVAAALGGRRHSASGPAAPLDSVAVLPVRNLTGDAGQEYLADSMMDLLTGRLAQVKGLVVPSVTSVIRYKGERKRVDEIARELEVKAVVETSVQRTGERLLINVQLIDARADRHLWGKAYPCGVPEIQAVLGTVAHDVLVELGVPLGSAERARLASAQQVTPEVNEAHLQGRYHFRKGTEADRAKAAHLFARAIELDPTFAPAYAGLALLHAQGGAYLAGGRLEARVKGRLWASRALELDETLAEAHTALGWLELADWDWRGADHEFRRAIELDPNLSLARVWYAQYLGVMRRFDEARGQSQVALRLDPADPGVMVHSGCVSWEAGRVDEAVALWSKAKDLDPYYWGARNLLGRGYLKKGLYQEAIAELQRAMELRDGPPSAMDLAHLAYAYARAGRRAEAVAIVAGLEHQARAGGNLPGGAMAAAYIGLGDHDRAFAWLEQAYQKRGEGMFFLNSEPLYEPLHKDPRFLDLLVRVGLPVETYPPGVSAGAPRDLPGPLGALAPSPALPQHP